MASPIDPDYIFWLMIQQLTGTLSREDAQYLDKLLERYPSIRDTWHQLLERFSAEDITDHMMRFDQEEYWRDMQLPEHLPAPGKRPFLPVRKGCVWVALVTVFAGTGGYFFFNTDSGRPPALRSPTAAVYPARAVQLQLAGGPVTDLSVPGKAIQAGGATLHANPEGLSYTPGNAEQPAATRNNILTVPVLPRWYGTQVMPDDAAIAKRRFQRILDRHKPVTVFPDLLKELYIPDYYFDKEGILHLMQLRKKQSS